MSFEFEDGGFKVYRLIFGGTVCETRPKKCSDEKYAMEQSVLFCQHLLHMFVD